MKSTDLLKFQTFAGAKGGVAPSGEIELTYDSNGTYTEDVSAFASAKITVDVQTGGGDSKIQELLERSIISYENSTIQTIGQYAFCNCKELKKLSLPNVNKAEYCAFLSCSSLEEIYIPELESIGQSTFMGCARLSEISIPKLRGTANNLFTECFSLKAIELPLVNKVQPITFSNCSFLSVVKLSAASVIGSSAFAKCFRLLRLDLVSVSSVPSLGNSNAFSSTPIGGYIASTGGEYGSIYVPASLYEAFLSATNWSLFSNRIVSV